MSKIRGFREMVFVLPVVFLLTFIVFIPMIQAFIMSFYNWALLSSEHTFIGLKNYENIFQDAKWIAALRNTSIYAICMNIIHVVLSIFFAILLNEKIRGSSFYRSCFFIPTLCSGTIAGIMGQYLFHPDMGTINKVLGVLGITGPGWLSDPKWALTSIILMKSWCDLGVGVTIMLAALQGVPESLYESSKIDGAGKLGRTRHVTLPGIRSQIIFLIIMAFITDLKVYDIIFVMTGGVQATAGGPGTSTLSLVVHIYQEAFRNYNMGYAASAAFMLFTILFILTLFQIRIMKIQTE